MRSLIQLLYITSIVSLASDDISSVRDDSLVGESSVANVINSLMSGPLKGRRVTLILQDDEENKSSSNDLLRNVNGPFLLLRFPEDISTGNHREISNDTNVLLNQTDPYHNVTAEKDFPLTESVGIILTPSGDASWWPFLFPWKEWKMDAIILLSTSPMCSLKGYFQAPLIEIATWLALLCPLQTRRENNISSQLGIRMENISSSSKSLFGVWTWKPYAAQSQMIYSGPWNPDAFGSWDLLFIDRFADMSRKNIEIKCIFDDFPILFFDDNGHPAGVSYVLVGELARWLKINLIVTSVDIPFGDLILGVKTGYTDAFINFGTITEQRNKDYDLTVPYHREGFGLMLEVPPPLPRWQNVLYPFTGWVWGAVFISTFCTSVLYHLIYREHEKSFVNNFVIIMQSLLSNPQEFVPVQWGARHFLLMWWTASWFISTFYVSNLIAVLTVPVYPKKLQTAKELADSKYRLCMLDYGEFVPDALSSSTHPTLSALGNVLDLFPLDYGLKYFGEERCFERVMAGTHSHTNTYSFTKRTYFLLGFGDGVYDLPDQLYPGYLAFVLPKNTPWKYKIDTGIQRLFETGLIQKWYKDFMEAVEKHLNKKKTSDLQPLALDHLQGAFFVHLIGLCFSSIVMVVEML